MLFQIAAMVDRQGAVIDWCTVGNHHQNAAVFGAGDQAVVRPKQRFAVDILFQQAFAHHQAKVAFGMTPWLIGFFVDDVAQVVEAAGHGLPSSREPIFTRLAALPRTGGEAQYLGFNAAAFQRACQYVGADCRDADRPSAHRSAVVDKQGHHGVAEIGFAFDLVRQRAARRDDDAREPRCVDHAFFLIEIPAAVLLRHQAALQTVGELCHHRLQVGQLLVEIGAQPVQLFFVGKLGRGDGFIIFGRPDFVIALRQMVPIAALRGNGLHAVIAHFAVGTVLIVHILAVIIGLGFFAFALLRFSARFGLASFAFAIIVAVAVLVLAVLGIIAAFIRIGRFDVAFGQVQMLEH